MNWKENRIESAIRGENPMVLTRMRSGFAVMGDTQFLPGYSLLLAYPAASSLNDLDMIRRQEFLLDMSLIGDAILEVYKPLRVNYDLLGNTDAFLHAHLFPRYDWEEESRKKKPVWLYSQEHWSLEEYQFDVDRHGDLKERLALKIRERMKTVYTL